MPIDENKPANNLIIDSSQISRTELQNRFGIKHETISGLPAGKHVTILAVMTENAIQGDEYLLLENALKNDYGILEIQTIFDATIPNDLEEDQKYNLHITGHLRIFNEK